VVTSPHHLSATMVTGRIHRMTELFGRLAPGATLEQALTELRTIHSGIMKDHPEAYPAKADFRISAVLLRDQITSKARTVLWVLLAASGLVFIIACSNVANLILARTIRREGELVVRAALGASNAALRRVLLAECLLLCGAGAALGVLSARPMVAILARYASRFSLRALDLTLDASMLWVGAGLALAAAALLAFVPRLPTGQGRNGISLSGASVRMTGGGTRRLRAFAVTQIAASFVLMAGAATLIRTLMELQAVQTGIDTRRVLAMNVPVLSYGRTDGQVVEFYKQAMRRVHELPGVDGVALGMLTPWRDGGTLGPACNSRLKGSFAQRRKTIRALNSALCPPVSSRHLACRSSLGAISTIRTAKTASRWRSSAKAWHGGCSRTARRSPGDSPGPIPSLSSLAWSRRRCASSGLRRISTTSIWFRSRP